MPTTYKSNCKNNFDTSVPSRKLVPENFIINYLLSERSRWQTYLPCKTFKYDFKFDNKNWYRKNKNFWVKLQS